MRRILLVIVIVFGLIAPTAVQAEAERQEDHKALIALRETVQKAINTNNFEMLKPLLVGDNITVITVDGKKCQSLSAFQDYWNKLLQTKEFGLDRIEVNPVADDPTEFLAENVGVCHGTSNDRYFFKSGDVRMMPERWTAVVLKDDGNWKVSRIIFSANILDNPVLTAIKQEMQNLIIAAGIGGLILGALAMWLVAVKRLRLVLNHCHLLIRGGQVFDGAGSSECADIAIYDGRIRALGKQLKMTGDREVDATGLWIAPGFIDIHTHYDLEVEIAPSLLESVRHGVTTVVMGGCSLSSTFAEPEELAHIFSRVETFPPEMITGWLSTARAWPSPQAYFEHLRELSLGPNVACMLGHSALRVRVMGLDRSLKEHATPREIQQMRDLAEEALAAGCIGISVDMVHWHKVNGPFAGRSLPSHHAAFAEYAMLADVCRKRDAVFQVTPNPENIWSLFDILKLSPGLWRAPLRNTMLAALDMDGAPLLWRAFSPLLFLCNQILGCNIRFQTLAEPFTIYADGHLTPFFEEFSAGVKLNNCRSKEERQALWRTFNFRKEFRESWRSGFPRTFHRDLERMTIISAPDAALIGKSIAHAARDANEDPLSYFMTLLELFDEALRWVACSANNRDVIRQKLMSNPYIFPGFSDAGAHSRNLAFFDSALSVVRQAASTGFLPIEKAMARVTGEPANWFNLETGHLNVGAKADLVILDPVNLKQPIPTAALISDPVLMGAARMVKRDSDPAVRYVFINGVDVIRDGAPLPFAHKGRLGSLLTQRNPSDSQADSLARYRNRISENSAGASAEKYWPIFLLKHQHPGNVALHCVGFLLMYAIPILALTRNELWILFLLPSSQAIGLFGHWLFERSPIDQRDTVFSWRAFLSLHLMFICVLTGQYESQLARVKNRVINPEQTR